MNHSFYVHNSVDTILDWAEEKMTEHAENSNLGYALAIAEEFNAWAVASNNDEEIELLVIGTSLEG